MYYYGLFNFNVHSLLLSISNLYTSMLFRDNMLSNFSLPSALLYIYGLPACVLLHSGVRGVSSITLLLLLHHVLRRGTTHSDLPHHGCIYTYMSLCAVLCGANINNNLLFITYLPTRVDNYMLWVVVFARVPPPFYYFLF